MFEIRYNNAPGNIQDPFQDTSVVMETGIAAKNNKIPIYASNFKREYQYIRGINKAIGFMVDIMEKEEFDTHVKIDRDIISNKFDSLIKYIKNFLKATKNGKLKDISNFEFDYYDIDNIYEVKFSIYYYLSLIQNYYDWSRGLNDKSLVSRYERYKHDLELFLSKINIKLQDTGDSDTETCSDSDSDSGSDTDSDSDNYSYGYL